MGNPYPFIDAILPSAAEMHEEAVLAHYERRLAEDAATIADLRDRLCLCRRYICRDCGCAIVRIGDSRCEDCGKAGLLYAWTPAQASEGPYAAACISVGLRRLCGRRILEGC